MRTPRKDSTRECSLDVRLRLNVSLPASMRTGAPAIVAQYRENTNDLGKIELVNVPYPSESPPAGMVTIQVKSAAVNPADLEVMKGVMSDVGWSMPLPFTIGYDFSGVIHALNEDDKSGFELGDAVFGVNWGDSKHDDDAEEPKNTPGGAFATYLTIPLSKISRKPDSVSHDEAAAIALVGTTAYQALFDCCKIAKGSRVLILGGSSSVGSIAIQLAKHVGAWVATTSSPRTREYVDSYHAADLIVDYTNQKWEQVEELKEMDAVFDCVGEHNAFERAKTILKGDGAYVTIVSPDVGFDPTAHPPLSFASMMILRNDPKVQDELANLMHAGKLRVVIEKRYPFDKEGVRSLLEDSKSGKRCGKGVLRISD